MPGDELPQVLDPVAERLVDEERQPGLDERPCPLDVLPAAIGGDDHRIDLPDHVFGAIDDVGNAGGPGHLAASAGSSHQTWVTCAPGMPRCSGGSRRDTGGSKGSRNRPWPPVVAAVDDGAPTIGMAVAVDHAQHGQADAAGREPGSCQAFSAKTGHPPARPAGHGDCRLRGPRGRVPPL